MQISVAQLADYIIIQAMSLESIRRKLFLAWLFVHSSQVFHDEESDPKYIQDALIYWFESLPEEDVLREFYLVAREISWWRSLNDESLGNIRTEKKKEKYPTILCLSDEN